MARQASRRYRDDAPLRAYAAIGIDRTVALVAGDGAIDWLALPDLDSPSVLGALWTCGGAAASPLAPTAPYQVTRRYLSMTNVLETTFYAGGGVVQVLDAMSVQGRAASGRSANCSAA